VFEKLDGICTLQNFGDPERWKIYGKSKINLYFSMADETVGDG
jgi:hypothetical protein